MVAQDNIKYQLPTTPAAEVFRTYDIRGEVSADKITPDLAYAIGLAIGSEVQQQRRHEVIVARDGRLSGASISGALIAGLNASGCDVLDIGRVPTPVLYFATKTLSCDSGVMVTASHNPGNHNGFKIVIAGQTINQDKIQTIYQRIVKQDFTEGRGAISQRNILPEYMEYIQQRIQLPRPLKVVVDCGNGIAGEIVPELYKTLGCEVIELFCEVDGHFPNHHPDPTIVENLQDIIQAVKQHQADLGLAFDGDADRLGIVTNKGEIIWPDRQLMLFAIDLLKRVPNSQIVFDVKCSRQLANVIREHGGKPIMYRTGHSVLKQKMQEINAPMAGEMSGHIFFQEGWLGFDDGIYVGARLMRILAEQDKSSSDVFAELPNSVNTPELKLPMAEQCKAGFMQQVLTQSDFGDAEKITIDGLRVEFADGWGLIRPSNTSPYLILRFEADNQAALTRIEGLFRQQLLAIDSTLQLPF